MFSFFLKYVLPLIVIGFLLFTVWQVNDTKPKQVQLPPPKQPSTTTFIKTVAGSGIIESKTENIAVGTAVPGIVMEVYVEVGQNVQPGQELFKIDDRELQAELTVRQQKVQSVEADLGRLQNLPRQEQIPVIKAQIEEAQANLAERADELKRANELVKTRTWTEQDLINRQKMYDVAAAQLRRTEAEFVRVSKDLIAWDYELRSAQAQIEYSKAEVQYIREQLKRCIVKAQEAGRVLQVNIRKSEYAATGNKDPLILLGNIEKLHIRVDIDEHDIPRIPKFQANGTTNPEAFARLKGETEEKIPLSFVREEPYVVPKKSLTGLSTERVDTRVLQMIFEVQPTQKMLYVGQQVDVFINAETSTKSNSTKETLTATQPSLPATQQ
jgi:HlyD family secretion protein